jgi:phospholipid/cholesterol/gamma-HCH transport system substrate-binding protein
MMARRNMAEVLTGLAVLIAAAGFLAYAVAHSGRTSVGGGYTLYARFSNIAGLGVGSDVRVAGVKIGSVESTAIDPKSYLAQVAMTIRDGVQLPKDSSVEVASESLLGGVYLAVQPGADETMLKPGESITITQGSISLQDLLGKFIFSATNMVSALTGSGQSGTSSGNAPKPTQGAHQ